MNYNKGCVYFFKHKNLKPIKIGYSKHKTPVGRLNQFNTYAPFGVEMIGYIQIIDAFKVEKYLHKKYSAYRLNGEWFNIDEVTVKKEIIYYNKLNSKDVYFDNYNLKAIFKNLHINIKIDNDVFYNYFNKKISKKRILIELKKYCDSYNIKLIKYNSNGKRGIKLTKI